MSAVSCYSPPYAPRTGFEPVHLRLDGAASTPLDRRGMRAPGGSRTPTPLRGPGSEPGVSTEVPPRAHEWSLPGSNRAPPACKAGALPDELRPLGASGRARTGYLPLTKRLHHLSCCAGVGAGGGESNPLRPAYKADAPPWLAGIVPSARFERALSRLSTWCLLPVGLRGHRGGSLAWIRTKPSAFRAPRPTD